MPRSFCLPLCFAVVSACWLPPRAGAQAPPAPTTRQGSEWTVLARSLQDRVIEYRQFGEGERQVLVVGPLEGDETAGLELVELLAEHLERFPRRSSGARVTLVRDPNPDGRLRRAAGNARGVLLNRNFPTRGWRKLPAGNVWVSGREPESEPESRALVDLVDDVQPDCVIVLAAARRSPAVAYAGPAKTLLGAFAKSSGLRPAGVNLAAEQGSFAVFTGADRKLPTLVVRVPAGMRRDALWAAYKRGLLAAIGGDHADGDVIAPRNAGKPPAGDEVAQQNAMLSQPRQTLLATAKRPTSDGTQDKPTAARRRILSAEELESAGKLVPVAPVRRQFGEASVVPPSRPSLTQPPAVKARATIRANVGGSFPPAVLAIPNVKRPSPVPLSTSGPQRPSAITNMPRVERLPPVGRASRPTEPQAMPRPIPLYPETGF